MFRNWQRTIWGLLVVASTTTVSAQDTSWAEKVLDRNKIDFGVVAAGSETKLRIGLRNGYQEALHIQAVRPSCGCISVKHYTDTLNSRDQGYIELQLDTIGHRGQKNVSVTVVFDQPQYAEVRIPIAAYIRTDVVMTPGSAQFGAVPKGSPHEKKLSLAYAGRPDWRITGVSSKNPHITCKPVEISRGGGRVDYEVAISIKSSAPVGDLREQIVLLTDDAGNPQVPVIVEAKIESEFSGPEVVSFGVVPAGDRQTKNVIIRGRRPFQVQKVESEKSVGTFEVRLPKEPKNFHIIPLTLIPSQPGEINEKFTLTIKDTNETIQFVVRGKVLGQTASQAVAPSLAN